MIMDDLELRSLKICTFPEYNPAKSLPACFMILQDPTDYCCIPPKPTWGLYKKELYSTWLDSSSKAYISHNKRAVQPVLFPATCHDISDRGLSSFCNDHYQDTGIVCNLLEEVIWNSWARPSFGLLTKDQFNLTLVECWFFALAVWPDQRTCWYIFSKEHFQQWLPISIEASLAGTYSRLMPLTCGNEMYEHSINAHQV